MIRYPSKFWGKAVSAILRQARYSALKFTISKGKTSRTGRSEDSERRGGKVIGGNQRHAVVMRLDTTLVEKAHGAEGLKK